MAYPKALILQGILGVGGLCASSAAGVGLGIEKAFGGVQSDAPADEPEIKPQNIKVVKEDDLGIPKECDTSCSLTAEQLKKLKFEARTSDSQITFDGLGEDDEFELIIEESSDSANYPRGKKYTLRPKTISGQVTIKGIKEGDITLGKDQEVLIREVVGGRKLEHLLEEVTELGIPRRCKSDEVTAEPKTCELTQHQLQKLNFETRGNEKIKVEGLNEGNLVTLKIEDKGDDRNNYPKGKKYILTSTSGDVTIKNVVSGDITIGAEGVLIRETEEGGKLEHLLEEVDRLGIPRRCNADQVSSGTPKTTCDLKQKQLKDLKFEPKEGASISVEGGEGGDDNSKFELIIEDKPNDKDNYPLGKKYKIQSTGTMATIQNVKEGNIHIWKNQSVVVREKQGGGRLEMAPVEVDELGIPRDCEESCQLTQQQLQKLNFETREGASITVEFLNKAKTVTLKVENRQSDKDNYPKGKKYTLTTTSGDVTIKGLKDEDITIGKERAVVIREKENEQKLEIAPEEIDNLLIPKRCNTGSKCQLTKEQLQRIKFEERLGSSISVDGLDEGNTVDLKVETTSNVTDYPQGKKYTFTSTGGNVTIQNTKDGNIVLEENKGVVFRVIKGGNKLETYLDVLGIPRGWGAGEVKSGSDPKVYCLSSEKLKDLRFKALEEGSGDVEVKGLKREEKIELTISWSDDRNNYPDNRKFSFNNISKNEDITISKGGQTVKIAKQKESWFKNNEGKLELVETKDRGQIAIEEKIGEKRKILKELGLEGLSIGDFVDGSSTQHSQTSVEFKNVEELKKIQFKDLNGSAQSTNPFSLGGKKIKVYLEWNRDEKKFPKNMKFLFENQYFSPFEFKKGNNSVKIPQRSLDIKNTEFKLEQKGDKWYLVRTNV